MNSDPYENEDVYQQPRTPFDELQPTYERNYLYYVIRAEIRPGEYGIAAQDFTSHNGRIVFTAALEVAASDEIAITLETIEESIIVSGREIIGSESITLLYDWSGVPPVGGPEYWARKLRDQTTRREVAAKARTWLGSLSNQAPAETIRLIEADIGVIAQRQEQGVKYMDLELELSQAPEVPPWILPGWFEEQDIVLLAGRYSCGKSTFALALGLSIAKGEAFCDLQPPRRFAVLFVDLEQTKHKFLSELALYGPLPDSAYFMVPAWGQAFSLVDSTGLTNLEEALTTCTPDLVIVDSWGKITSGVDENSNTEIGMASEVLVRLRNKYSTGFLLIDHSGKDNADGTKRRLGDQVRGAAKKMDACDTGIIYVRDTSADHLDPPARPPAHVTMIKNRAGNLESMLVGIESNPQPDGTTIRTLVSHGPVDKVNLATRRCYDTIKDWIPTLAVAQFRTKDAVERCIGAEAVTKTNRVAVSAALKELQRDGVIRLADGAKRGIWVPASEVEDSLFPRDPLN